MAVVADSYAYKAKVGLCAELCRAPQREFLQRIDVLTTQQLLEWQSMHPGLKARILHAQITGARQLSLEFCFSNTFPEARNKEVFDDLEIRVATLFNAAFMDFNQACWGELKKAVFTFFNKESWDVKNPIHTCRSIKCNPMNCLWKMKQLVNLLDDPKTQDQHDLIEKIANYLIVKMQDQRYVMFLKRVCCRGYRKKFTDLFMKKLSDGESSSQRSAYFAVFKMSVKLLHGNDKPTAVI